MDDRFFIPQWDVNSQDNRSRCAQLVHFGDCCGMFHAGASSEAIIIVPPFGHEALACAKSLRLLAERLAQLGYSVLRMDAKGTGDAPGDEAGLDIFANRVAAVQAAADWLRAKTGVSGVSLAGARLGGTIAMLAADSISAQRLFLAAPVLSGRAYLRELQQMRLFYASAPGSVSNAAENEFNGFKLSEDSLATLRKLDLRKCAPGGAQRVAFFSPSGLGGAMALAGHWLAQGVQADFIDDPNTDALLADPATAPPAMQFVETCAEWFGPATGRRSGSGQAAICAGLETPFYREDGQWIGENRNVFGVMCRPAANAQHPDRGAVVLVNTGGNPHTGWGRQTVELARKLAGDGIASLRIDVNGVGETPDLPGRPGRVVYKEESHLEILAAVSHLRALGYESPAIVGTCSGAFLAFHAARQLPEISGVLMINLQKFYWREGDALVLYSSMGSYFSKLRDWSSWKKALQGEANLRGVGGIILRRISNLFAARVASLLPKGPQQDTNSAERPAPRAAISAMCQKGIKVHMAYTSDDGGMDEMRSHIGHEGRMVRSGGNFAFTIVEGADHNFSTAASRERLYPLVREFAMGLAG